MSDQPMPAHAPKDALHRSHHKMRHAHAAIHSHAAETADTVYSDLAKLNQSDNPPTADSGPAT